MAKASLNETDRSMKSLTDCMYFINGTCFKGDKCLFRHCRAAAEQTNACFKWPNTCRNVHCRYRHPSVRLKTEKSPPSIPVTASLPRGSPISFFWDIENVTIPRSQKPFDIIQRIRQRLVVELGLREIGFTCYGDTNCISKENQFSLAHANVRIVHVPDRKSGDTDRQILLDLDRFERTQRPPAMIVLISGNIDFALKVSDLRHQVGFHVTVVHNKPNDKELKASANAYIPWEMFTEQSPPSLDTPVLEQASSQNDRKSKIKTSHDHDRSLSSMTNFDVPATHIFACHQCDSAFNSERALQQHQQDKEHIFTCPICSEGFFTYAARSKHQYVKDHQEKSVTKCTICQKILKPEECFQHLNETGHSHFNAGPPSLFPPAPLTTLREFIPIFFTIVHVFSHSHCAI